ncbi:glucose 1-dehydrogenase [Pullulanibacillus sp. KACC 23026]|uniref:SDR family NAD(P)-dependent oxidoreductase n=1 Tax=Pullulanibacillus sp. KACC 23026 TaxID=3028315 RepID=UPI0023B0CE88|nr:glucose 1-dehydrogenase [Pullulanibacillus sp. KACC 23026]WEG11073.1 glucose 1-dehydrogenase [Pullulanibacillus sp. KACC 23026]
MKLNGQVAIVTGGASGIGEATVDLFTAEGAKVVIADLNKDKLESVVNRLKAQGREVVGVCGDVSEETQVKHLINTTIKTFGKLDVLFNNAGTILSKGIDEIESHEWDRLFEVNVKSMYLTIKYSLSFLEKTKGRIVNMASMTGVAGQRRNPAYSATKGAVISLTKSLAVDMAPKGVRINAICPAGVMTPLLERWLEEQPDPDLAKLEQDRSHLLGYTAEAEEIASVVLFLSNRDSSFITGEVVTVDGGATLGYGAGIKAEWKFV